MDSTLSRRSLLLGGLAAGAAPANVLFLMADQFRHDALSCAGNPIVETPNLDRLAAEGVRFTDAVCSSPLCGPSRASLLTGQYAHGHRCWGNFEIGHPGGLPESAQTWDETLAANGYRVEYHGKWHTGAANRSCYHDGLPYYLDRYHKYLEEQYPGRKKAEGEAVDRYTKWPYRPFPVDRMMAEAIRRKLSMPHHNEAGENTVPASKSLTAWTAGGVVRFLQSKPKQPFSITCSILHPHAPLVASPPYTAMYNPAKMPMPRVLDDEFTPPEQRGIPKALTLTPDGLGTYIALYYGLVREVDDWVGRILAALDGAGLASNTLVVFLADHGEMLGEHSRVSKMVFYEASLRVPLLMRLPGRIPKGRKLRAPASGADVAPTILDYCNIPVPQRNARAQPAGGHRNRKATFAGRLFRTAPPGCRSGAEDVAHPGVEALLRRRQAVPVRSGGGPARNAQPAGPETPPRAMGYGSRQAAGGHAGAARRDAQPRSRPHPRVRAVIGGALGPGRRLQT